MLLHRAIRPGIVLVVVNLPARVVLLMIDLCALLRREFAAVRRSVAANFTVDLRLSVLESARLTRIPLPRLRTVRNPRLLLSFARIDPADCRRRRSPVILGCEVLTIRSRAMLVPSLRCRRPHVRLAAG